MSTHRLLGEILIKNMGISATDIHNALEKQVEEESRIGEILVKSKILMEKDVLKALAIQQHILFREMDPKPEDVELDLIEQIPLNYAKQNRITPLWHNDDGTVEIALSDPGVYWAIDDVASKLRKKLSISLMESQRILELINKAYTRRATSVDLGDENEDFADGDVEDLADNIDIKDEAPIIRWVNAIIYNAAKERASDIHIEPGDREVVVRYRIDGVLYETKHANKNYLSAIIARVKIMSGLDIAEKRLPQDGRIRRKIAGRDIDFRVATIPTARGERITIRLLDQSSILLGLGDIGFAPRELDLMEDLIERPHGIILVTGPTGSGKTTTLYASLNKINSPELNILTIEDPVEYQLEGISQVQVNPKIHLTFAAGLRSFLRHDPDVIMVGEIRDLETAEIAIQASLTGHLVLSTVHTNDSAGALTRLVDMGVEPFLVASSLNGILAQRLVRRLCPVCKEEYEPTPEEIDDVGLNPDEFFSGMIKGYPVKAGTRVPGPGKLFRAKGCPQCLNTGYQGRTGIYELLMMDDDIRAMSMKKIDANQIKKLGVSKGLKTLRQDGAYKAISGITSLSEVMLVTAEDIA
ncbi:MAG: type II secretion system ATPase GspE [Deltaproteobacteria bacterium]|nr:type II secretion system ATPase GspE [Deltaproteobacteria bacterium]